MDQTILAYLADERKLSTQIVADFLIKIRKQYQSLTPEFTELLQHLEAYLLTGGKWLRPSLGMLAYQIMQGNDLNLARQSMVVTEIMHRFLLVHDDIMDQDLVRHHQPTLEKIYHDHFTSHFPGKTDQMYSKGVAIVAGDIIHTFVYDLITQLNTSDNIKLAAIKGINQLFHETAAGWQLQTEQNFMKISEVSEADFFQGMQLVSAQYSVVWPLRIGQIFAGRLTKNDWDKNLDTYGWHTGAAFQLADDILGMFGNETETGKPAGHDYREGKKTYLILKAYDKANKLDKKFLDTTLGTQVTPSEVNRARQIIINTGALAYTQTQAQDHVTKAKAALGKIISPKSETLTLLSCLSDFLSHRTH